MANEPNAVKVTGDIYVPLTGTNELTNGSFVDWADPTVPDGWTKSGTHNATNYVEESPADSLRLVSDGAGTGIIQIAVTIGKTYFVEIIISVATLGAIKVLNNNMSIGLGNLGVGTHSVTFTAQFTGINIFRDGACDVVTDSITVLELAEGPVDTYPWDSATDFTTGGEPLGILNGERVYKSSGTHADGAGGADVNYYLNLDANGFNYLSQTVTNKNSAPSWAKAGGGGVLGDYSSRVGPPLSFGTATVSAVSAVAGGGYRGRQSGSGGYRKPLRSRYA